MYGAALQTRLCRAAMQTASADLGAKLWEAVVDAVAATFQSIAESQKSTDLVNIDRLHFLGRSPDG